MLVTRKSMFTGLYHTREIEVTQEQIDAHRAGALIQDAMPNLSAEDREFMLTGVTPEEWLAFMGREDDEEDWDIAALDEHLHEED